MRKVFTKILIAVLAFLVIIAGFPMAALADTGIWSYDISSGQARITGYSGPGGAVVIPDTLEGCPVTQIGVGAFSLNHTITSVSMPDTIKIIGDTAFLNCIAIESMHVSTALQYIGERAFGDCQALISFDMPAGVTTIGIGAFINDQQLKSIVIPEGITNIYADTFRQCYALESVTLPDSLQVIGSCAFMYCMSLTSIDFPRHIGLLGDCSFYVCSSLTRANFYGAIPTFERTGIWNVFDAAAPGFKIYYHVTQTTWLGYGGYITKAFCKVKKELLDGSVAERGYYDVELNGLLSAPPSDPTRTGYSFGGWYREAACVNAINPATEIIKNNITLYAYWIPNICTVRFDSKGGSSVASIDAPYGSMFPPPANPTKSGYFFGWWCKDSGCTSRWDFYSQRVSGNITLYAKWLQPSVPTLNSAASASYNSILVKWNAALNASGYEVWRSTSSAGTYTLAATTAATSCTNTGLATNTTYYYKVRSYKQLETSKIYSAFSGVKSAKPVPGVPANVKAARASATSIRVSWNAVAGTTKYEIWRCLTSNRSYALVTSTASVSYTNTGLAKGKVYYYKVRAYRLVGSTKVYGNYCGVVYAKTY
jgi:uncharacterized repeat protein (TIGR02543 family)